MIIRVTTPDGVPQPSGPTIEYIDAAGNSVPGEVYYSHREYGANTMTEVYQVSAEVAADLAAGVATKDDGGKLNFDAVPPDFEEGVCRIFMKGLRLDLVPLDFLEELALLYTRGAIKYADNNWLQKLNPVRWYRALRRHTLAIRKGEIMDPETGVHHATAVAWNAIALTVYSSRAIMPEPFPVDDKVQLNEMYAALQAVKVAA